MQKKNTTCLLLCLSLLFAATVSIRANAALDAAPDEGKHQVAPRALYHHVWQLISERFYDPTYNNQKWGRWEHRYDGQLKTLADARKAIDTMVASLGDRYTRYLDPSAFDDEKQQIESKLFGVGIQLGLSKTQKLVCISPIEGMPAAEAGIMANDEISEIDGKSTNGLSVEQAAKMIRGEIGTAVKLAIIRNGEKKEYVITRGEIPIKSVQSVKMLNGDIGYLHLSTFMSERANQEVRDAIEKLSPARGIIIDLRNNGGGLVTNARDICSLFLEGSGVVFSTIDRTGVSVATRATGRNISHQALVVLINPGTASAAEITSGCLHDSNRAQLVGEKSFGKGIMQSITRLEDGSGVNITIARYLTPNNTDIHKKGIVPDYTVELKPQDYKDGRGPWFIYKNNGQPPELSDLKDAQLEKAVEVLEKNEQFAAKPLELKLDSSFGSAPGANPFPNSLPLGTSANSSH